MGTKATNESRNEQKESLLAPQSMGWYKNHGCVWTMVSEM